jgi:ribA/ribD-fused uncharacterized protein
MVMKNEEKMKTILDAKKPIEAKRLGNDLEPFDEIKWNEVSSLILGDALYFKFGSDPKFKSTLMSTRGNLIVEAREDEIWGSGLTRAETKKFPMSKWRGPNKLGEELMKLRDFFEKEENRVIEIAGSPSKDRASLDDEVDDHLTKVGTVRPSGTMANEPMIRTEEGWAPQGFEMKNWTVNETQCVDGKNKNVSGAFALVDSLRCQYPKWSFSRVSFRSALDTLFELSTAKGNDSKGEISYTTNDLAALLNQLTSGLVRLIMVSQDMTEEYQAVRVGEGSLASSHGLNLYVFGALGEQADLYKMIFKSMSPAPKDSEGD